MFGVEEDGQPLNCLCSALKKTDSRCLAESDIPNHHHGCYETECPDLLIRIKRQAYTCYFNEKYGRKGPLGEPGYFEMELEGLQHKLTAISYTVRNTVHHGITSTPFEWPFCSANAYFRKELGKLYVPDLLLTPAQIRAALPRRARFNPQWKMGVEGVFLRESVIETEVVENLYATPKAFNYLITRLSGEDWSRRPITTAARPSPWRASRIWFSSARLLAKRQSPTCSATRRTAAPRWDSMTCNCVS